MTSPEPIQVFVTNVEIPDTATGLWTNETMVGMDGEPSWFTSDVARFFFGRDPRWLRWCLAIGGTTFDGMPIKIPRSRGQYRRWRLYDIERLAHGLAQHGHIQVTQLVRVIEIIKLVAQNYHYIKPVELETRIELRNKSRVGGRQVAVETFTQVKDDLDGTPGATPRTFAIGATTYRIDLTDEHYREMIELMQPYISAASPARNRRQQVPEAIEQRKAVREWAREHHISIGERGRIPNHVLEAYERAQLNGRTP